MKKNGLTISVNVYNNISENGNHGNCIQLICRKAIEVLFLLAIVKLTFIDTNSFSKLRVVGLP